MTTSLLPSPQEAAKELLRRREARGAMLPFVQYLDNQYQAQWYHKILCEHLDAFVARDIENLMVFMPPQHGKPIYTKAMILMADGSRKALEDVVIGDSVVTHEGRARKVSAVFEQGELECVEITTQSGRSVIAALDHPFLTPSGWVNAGDIREAMVLANVPNAGIGSHDVSHEAFRLAGYFVGDGHTASVAKGSSIGSSITCFDAIQADDIRHCANSLGFVVGREDEVKKRIPIGGGCRDWLREIGLAGCGSKTKRVPEFVFKGDAQRIGHFIGAYFSCDGHINTRGADRGGRQRKDPCVEVYSVNRPLLDDLQHLLLRLGVQSRVAAKNSKHNAFVNGPHTSYRLTISSRDDVARFVESVPVFGCKMATLEDWGVVRQKFSAKYLEDKVVSVERIGLKECRCLTVEEDHTFTASDFVVHNSQLVSRALPAYIFGKLPDAKVIAASYAAELIQGMNRDVQRFMELPEYRKLFPGTRLNESNIRTVAGSFLRNNDIFEIVGRRGQYRCAGVGGGLTGFPCDFGIIDDPYKDYKEASSVTVRRAVWEWYTSVFLTRTHNNTGKLLTQTRWHEEDLAGILLNLEPQKWTVLKLPAICEKPDSPNEIREAGETLWPERFSMEQLLERKELNPHQFEALYQQNPTPREGSMFKVSQLEIVEAAPANMRTVRCWDIAATAGAGDYSVGAKMGTTGDGVYYVLDVVRGQWATDERDQVMRQTAQLDGASTKIRVPQDPGAAGKSMASAMVRMLAGFSVQSKTVSGDKVTRADPLSSQVNVGNVKMLRGEWNRDFIEELRQFPNGKDDQVDAVADCFEELARGNDFFFV